MSRVNEALEHLHAGKARYRIVLENDLRGGERAKGTSRHGQDAVCTDGLNRSLGIETPAKEYATAQT